MTFFDYRFTGTASCIKAKPSEWKTSTRFAATTTALLVLLAITGCGSKTPEAPVVPDDPAARAAAVRNNTSIPPQAKEEMLRNLEKQANSAPAPK